MAITSTSSTYPRQALNRLNLCVRPPLRPERDRISKPRQQPFWSHPVTDRTDDPLGRALIALDYLKTPNVDPAAWQELQRTLLVAQAERAALLTVAQEAGDLVDAVAEYEDAVEAGKVNLIDKLGEACVEAEDALVDALNQVHAVQSGEAELSGEQAYLTVLDRYADNEDEEPRH